MKFLDLKGKEHDVIIKSYKNPQPSGYHIDARRLLKELYPSFMMTEEFSMPGTQLKIDFFIPMLKIAVEVQGSQHFEYNKHFHENKKGFEASKNRDNDKTRWCEINGISLIEFNYNESTEQWRNKLVGKTS